MTAPRVALTVFATGATCLVVAVFTQYGGIAGLVATGIAMMVVAPIIGIFWSDPRF